MSRDKPRPGPKKPEYEPRGDHQCFAYFVEECGEVLAAAGKTMRWGVHSYNPELPEAERESNGAWLRRELGDLSAAIERLPVTVVLSRESPHARQTSGDPCLNLVSVIGRCVTAASAVMDGALSKNWMQRHIPLLVLAIDKTHDALDRSGIPR